MSETDSTAAGDARVATPEMIRPRTEAGADVPAVDNSGQLIPDIPTQANPKKNEEIKARNLTLVTQRDEARSRSDEEAEQAAKSGLVEANQALVTFLVKRYMGRGIETEDLRQEAHMALLEAAEDFDATRGTQFGTFANLVISRSLTNLTTRESRQIHIPSTFTDRWANLLRTEERLQHVLGRVPTHQEIAVEMGIEPDVVSDLFASYKFSLNSLDDPKNSEEGELSPQRDNVGDPLTSTEESALRLIKSAEVLAILQGTHFSDRDKAIIQGLSAGKSQRTIAAELGVTQTTVSKFVRNHLRPLLETYKDN